MILKEHGGKWAEAGSVRWAFEPLAGGEREWKAKFPQELSEEGAKKLSALVDAIEENGDVQRIFTNAQ
jgi:transcriptional/translational regulatory protein YebC/TACO1